ncbi:MAG: hypothetical protein K0U66_10495, partial [Gammaproteobacteria bacterium]|nr:hypothetical protein [Gammaproteobacteria bacterium]
PFGTTLGKAADINCTADYADARLALADACREGTTPVGGATCTVAVNRCIANPFSDSVFNGGACDRVAFANAQVPYCETDANPWQTNCDSLVAANDSIARARGDVCINNRAIPSSSQTSQPLAAGESLFNAICEDAVATDGTELETAQIGHCSMDENSWHTSNCGTLETSNPTITQARANICVDNKEIDKGDGSPILAGMSLFSTDCENVTAADGIRTGMTARTAWCTVGDNIFDTQCGADNDDTYGATTAARNTACATTGDTPLTSVGTNNCASRADAICGINSAAGTNPFAAICSVATQNVNHVATLLDSQRAYCRDVANNPNEVCTSTIQAVCETGGNPITTTTAIFDGLCLGADYEAAQRTYCSVTAILDDTSCKDNMQGSLSVKDVVCNGDDVADTPYATVCGTDMMAVERQRAFCGLTDNSTATGCAATIAFACDETTTTGDPFHVLCTAPNEADRILRAESCRAGNVDSKICNDVVNSCNNDDPFDASCDSTVYASALVAFCTVGDNIFDARCISEDIAGTAAARLARCAGPVTDLGSSAVAATCLDESVAICGTETAPGTNAYAEICNDPARNANHATLTAVQTAYCNANDRRFGCTDDNAAAVTSGDFARGQAAPLSTDPTAESQFLEIASDSSDISTTGTLTETAGGGVAPTPTTLDFSELEYGGASLNLDATEGVTFFTGFIGNTEYAYAGIFGTTNLGAPIATNTTATWNGLLNINGTEEAFDLEVVFSDSADNTVKGFAINPIDTKDFLVDGTFDANGVITGNVHYDDFASDTRLNISAPNGVLSGIIGADGAVGVFYNTTGDLYVGGFVVSPDIGICTTNVFDTDCPVSGNNLAETAFCLNPDNIFNTSCIEDANDGTVHGTPDQLKGLRDAACLARGDMADDTCKNREEVRMACNTNVYTQTTGLDTNINLCTGTATDGGEAYSARQTACQAAATTFAQTWCNGGDTSVAAVNDARNSYCSDKARSESDGTGNGNCVSRLAATCTTNDGTAPFSGICGTAVTPQQVTACGGTLIALAAKGAVASDCNNALLSGAICGDASSMGGSNPFADICSNDMAIISGFNKATAQLAICGGLVSDLTDGGAQLSDCRTDDLSGAICGTATTVGSDPFAPICGESSAIVSGFVLATAQLTICGGELTGFNGAAEVTDCKTAPLAGMICGTGSTPGSDPFAPICAGDGALASYNQAAAQLAICS